MYLDKCVHSQHIFQRERIINIQFPYEYMCVCVKSYTNTFYSGTHWHRWAAFLPLNASSFSIHVLESSWRIFTIFHSTLIPIRITNYPLPFIHTSKFHLVIQFYARVKNNNEKSTHSNVENFPELFNAQMSQTIPTMRFECKCMCVCTCECVCGGCLSIFILSLWTRSNYVQQIWFIQFPNSKVFATSYQWFVDWAKLFNIVPFV